MKDFHIITFAYDCGEDDKNDCKTFGEALKWASYYLRNGWDKARIVRHSSQVQAACFTRVSETLVHCQAPARYMKQIQTKLQTR